MSDESHVVPYPFIRCVADGGEGDGEDYRRIEFLSWRPGIQYRCIGYYGDDSEGYANAMGKMHLTLVSTHKPGRYPERAFYTREWESPDGHLFGKPGLHIATSEKFLRLCKGYQHDFVVDPKELADDVVKIMDKPPAPKTKPQNRGAQTQKSRAPITDARLPPQQC